MNAASATESTADRDAFRLHHDYGAIGGYQKTKERARSRDENDLRVVISYLTEFGGEIFDLKTNFGQKNYFYEYISAEKCFPKQDAYWGMITAIILNSHDFLNINIRDYDPVQTCLVSRGVNQRGGSMRPKEDYAFCKVQTITPKCFLE